MRPCATGGVQYGTKTRIVQTIGCLSSPRAGRELPKTVWERAPLQDIYSETTGSAMNASQCHIARREVSPGTKNHGGGFGRPNSEREPISESPC